MRNKLFVSSEPTTIISRGNKKVTELLRSAKIFEQSKRLTVFLDALRPQANRKSDKEITVISYTSDDWVSTQDVIEFGKTCSSTPADLWVLLSWAIQTSGELPFAVALGTVWSEGRDDPEEWAGAVCAFLSERDITAVKVNQMFKPGTLFLFVL